MRKLPLNNLADFSDGTLFDNLHEAQAEELRCWIEYENQPTAENLTAYRNAWDYQDAVYFELARRDNAKLLQECMNILAPKRRRPYGQLGGITT